MLYVLVTGKSDQIKIKCLFWVLLRSMNLVHFCHNQQPVVCQKHRN